MTNDLMYICPSACPHLSDADAIQAAVNTATEKDIRTVVIPSTKKWQLEKPVYLPNGITLILDGAQIVSESIAFTNANADKEDQLCLGGEQEQLFLLGRNGASIQTQHGPQVYFQNVKNFGINGICFVNGYGIRLLHCRFGKVQQVQFRESRYGVFLGEGCNNNLLEDLLAETKEEAVIWCGGNTAVWGRSADIYDCILSRLDAKTCGAPAVALSPGPVAANNLFIRDVTDRTAGNGVAIRLGNADEKELLDLSVRGVETSRTTVSVSDNCDGVFLANLNGKSASISPNATRVLIQDSPEQVTRPRACAKTEGAFLDANDPRYAGATDHETLQNAIDAAVGKCLIIPRYNARTGSRIWNIERTLQLPSDTTLILLDAHLRLADFTYCNLFSNAPGASKNIHIYGVGSATLDSGSFNGLKAKNANTLGFGPITDNALVLFAGVDNLEIKNLHMVQKRWYCVLCVGCTNAQLSDLDICAHPYFPDMGGIRIHSGCHNVLIENITGLTGEDTILLSADPEDDRLYISPEPSISHIHIRTVKANPSRCCIVNILAKGGRKVHNIVAETLLDCSVPEQKKMPYACVQVGDSLSDHLSDILIRDLTSRATGAVQMGGHSKAVRISNIHGYGSCSNALRTMPLPESYDYPLTSVAKEFTEMGRMPRAQLQNWHVSGVFFRCHQASSYMRGTATSIITDKKKYIGTVANLPGIIGENVLIENILADRIGNGILVTGNAAVDVRNFLASEIGKETATCGKNCCLTVNEKRIPVKESQAL